MNPLTNMKNVTKLSEQELKTGNKTSWHDQYKNSSWIFVGGLPYDLTEGDIISVFSQYGEVVNINLIRDKKTGKQKGFSFLCYEDQRSTVLAVDNLNGIKLLGKSIRVDHVNDYKPPRDDDRYDDITRKLHTEGCAPQLEPIRNDKKRREENPMRKRLSPPARTISPDIKRVKKERRSEDRDDNRHRHQSSSNSSSSHHKKSSKKKKKDRKKRHSSTSSESN